MEAAGLERLLLGRSELLLLVDCHHPETGHCLVVVTLALAAVALDEGSGAEVLQARSGAGKSLSTTTMADGSVLKEAKTRELSSDGSLKRSTHHDESVANPETFPAGRAFGNLQRLTVHSNDVRRHFTDDAARDV